MSDVFGFTDDDNNDNNDNIDIDEMDDEIIEIGNSDSEDDSLQDLLDEVLSLTAPAQIGKRGGGRKVTNNIGADDLKIEMLNFLKKDHHVNLFVPGNLKRNTLWGVIDDKAFSRAESRSREVEPSYSKSGILAVSLMRTTDGRDVIQWWKGTLSGTGVLTFSKIIRKGGNYQYGKNLQGETGIWRVDSSTNEYVKTPSGYYEPFPFHTLVDFEVYMNAIVTTLEVGITFPDADIPKLRGLQDLLANLNNVGESKVEESKE